MKTKLLFLFMQLWGLQAFSQLFKLDSIVASHFERAYLPAMKHLSNPAMLPVIASRDLIIGFQLRDTIVGGVVIKYYSSADEVFGGKFVTRKGRKQKYLLYSLSVQEASSESLSFKVEQLTLEPTRSQFRPPSAILVVNGYFLVRYSFQSGCGVLTME